MATKHSHVAGNGRRVLTAARRAVETLESRMFLSATLTSPISNLAVTQDASPTTIDLNAHFDDPQVVGPTVSIQTPNGSIPIELFPSVTPANVSNFLGYVDSGDYNGTIVHRNAKSPDPNTGQQVPFVIQGGGFKPDGSHIPTTRSGSGVPDEFHFSNTRGTVAMAKTSSPNSATSEWFINENDANTFLDAQKFSVFGRVLYGGMSVVGAIAALTTTSATTLNSAFTDLPIESASGGIASSNLVTTSISRTPHVFLTMKSDNATLVTPTLGDNNQMVLSYGAGQSGYAHVTVTATDLGNNSVSQTFRVHVTAAAGNQTQVVLGVGGAKSVTYTQPDKTVVSISLKNPGTATLTFVGQPASTTLAKGIVLSGTSLDPNIAITGATGATTLTITPKGGAKVARIGDIATSGDFGTINAKAANLDGDLAAVGSVKAITLNGANDGAISIGAGVQALTLKTSAVFTDEVISSAAVIKSITTPGWTGTSQATSSLAAPAVGSISVKGSVHNTIFNLAAPGTLDLGRFAVSGAMSGMTINAAGNIGAVSAASMINDTIYAGVKALAPGQPLPNFPGDFASLASIGSVSVKASRSAPTFSNTSIAAQVLGSLSLGRIQTANGGVTFGVAAHKIAAITGTDATSNKKLSLHKLDNPAVLTTLESKLGFSLQDFVIKLF